ncbi:MAG: hypothetical protein ACON4Z_03510 [Planctomycetota bacterium]
MSAPPPDRDTFYVGYLPLPAQLRAFVRGAVALALLAVVGVTVTLATAQPRAGDGSWAEDTVSFEGVLTLTPYPMLHGADPDGGSGARAWLLVSSIKSGVAARAAAALGDAPQKRVRVRGHALRRRGQRAVSLVDDPDAITVLGDAPAVSPSPPAAAGTFVGEIIDPKCWLGAMRPGSGLVHRACASLCIRGGIPPCFVGGPEGRPPRFYVLTDAAGAPCNDAVAERAGVLVRLQGDLVQLGAATLLRCELSTIEDVR